MRVVLREVLKRMTLRAPSPRPERPKVKHVTVIPACDCRVVLVERRAPEPRSETGERKQLGRRALELV
jgi:hypothetical protein